MIDVTLQTDQPVSLTLLTELRLEVIIMPIPVVEYSFVWTAPSTGASWTVTIPSTISMLDVTYSVSAYTYGDVPAGGDTPILNFPESGKTLTTFPVSTGGVLTVGTVVTFTVRDV